jgi:hypothetical protein
MAGELIPEDADHGRAVAGPMYRHYLARLHRELRPGNYLEVGTLNGDTLAIAQCASIAVDPWFRLTMDVVGKKPVCLLYQQRSDDFFRTRDPSAIFGSPVDLAFLDGMHLAEFLLRDFINTERHCLPGSVIVLHDCLPPGYLMTVRDVNDPRRKLSPKYPNYWTGDVWQVVPVLRRFRPDLSIAVTDCPPTGLVVITGLDPASEVLAKAYDEIVGGEFPRLAGRAAYDAYWAGVRITPAERALAELMGRRAAGAIA